jgi:hypothetical protein
LGADYGHQPSAFQDVRSMPGVQEDQHREAEIDQYEPSQQRKKP